MLKSRKRYNDQKQKTKAKKTQTLVKQRVNISYSISVTRRVTYVQNPVISHDGKIDGKYQWSSVITDIP